MCRHLRAFRPRILSLRGGGNHLDGKYAHACMHMRIYMSIYLPIYLCSLCPLSIYALYLSFYPST